MPQLRRLTPLSFLVVAVVTATAVPAAFGQVRDDGEFFSPDAVRRANEQIGQIREQYKTDFVVETFPSVPAELRGAVQQDKAAAYAQWIDQRARAARTDGIHVLITKNPSYLEAATGRETEARKVFSDADREELVQRMLGSLKAKENDRALLGAVNFVNSTLRQHAATAAPARPAAGQVATPGARPANPGWTTPTNAPARRSGFSFTSLLFWGALILGGIWLLRRMMGGRRTATAGYPANPGAGGGMFGGGGRGPVNPNDPNYHPQQTAGYGQPGYGPGGYGQPGYGQQQGGGFGRGVGGGLLGGLAGGWLYDKVFRGPGQSGAGQAGYGGGAAPLPSDQPGGGVFGAGDDAGQGFGTNASGGSFGDDAGGGFDAGGGGGGAGGDNNSGGSF